MSADYSGRYDPDTDFDRWYTGLTARRLRLGAGPTLEIGSATGMMTALLAAPGRQIDCIERAAPYADRARARALPNATIHNCDIEAFKTDQLFSDILAINILHELPDPSLTVRRCRDWLAPNGKLHVTLPNPDSLHRLSAFGAGLIDNLAAPSQRGTDLHTLRLTTADQVAQDFAKIGFRELSREGVLPKPLPNAGMETLSSELIEAWDALAPLLPNHCAMTYSVFVHA